VKNDGIDHGFVSAKVVCGLVKGWEEGLKSTTGAIFTYGENLVSSAFYGVSVVRTVDLDAISSVWLLHYVCQVTAYARPVVARFLLPTTPGAYDRFLEICKALLTKGELYLLPGLTPHNLEAYLIFNPLKIIDAATVLKSFKEVVLKRMYHMYKASTICNFARTVSYCLMLPGNVGKVMFYPAIMNRWIGWILSCYKGSFHVDKMNRTKVYKRVTLDDIVTEYQPIEYDDTEALGVLLKNGAACTELKKRKFNE